ncbi:AraC family transcriptional regulator [Dyadobacter sp. CY326]|uniref:AraC family transcriptional regulator n=1 Tax=Dyadobacter sp. CY326 TaxID=2907300 RepID=UPI001F1B5EAD|nr:AraC family transcriptional regulator [Dyadobacter sp. CY326]MCE7064921.1 AraC family transcriptional regulator [Dyadobacter sp. CY326]
MYSTIRVLRNIIYAASAKGGNVSRLCNALGIEPSDLADADRKVEDVNAVIKLWEEVIAATGDHAFGLHMGQENNPGVLGLLGYLMQSCPTIKDAFAEIVKYQQTISGWISYDFHAGKESEIVFGVSPLWSQISPETARHGLETAISGSLAYIRIFTGERIYPIRAELAYSSPVPKADYERVLQCQITFGGKRNVLYFPKEFAEFPLVSYDESLYMSFAEILRTKHAVIMQQAQFAEQVRQAIIKDFYGKMPPLEVIAAHMNVSERSFQRKLQQEDESYRSVGAKIKQELAFNLLKNTNATMHAISEVLGYTEPSAFHRAFKSWTQTSPAQKKRSFD